jgi:hypothetical protein
MIDQKTLSALYKSFICGLAFYGISMSLAYAGYIGQDYSNWCDPTYCCDPKTTT